MGLDTVELVMDVEDHFGILLREEESQKIRTIGDLADVILLRILASSTKTCPTIRVFYETRSLIRESLNSPKLRMRPSTKLIDLIPPSKRRHCWSSIRCMQPWRFPGLQMNRPMYVFTLTLIAIVYVIPFTLIPLEMWVISLSSSSLLAIVICVLMNRFRSEFPLNYKTVGDLVRSSVGSIVATKRTNLISKELVLADLYPIVANQFGVDLDKLTQGTRFVEDLGAD